MTIKQLYLHGFSHHLSGSRARSSCAGLVEAAGELGGLSKMAGRFFPQKLLANPPGNRSWDFPLPVTFWAFLSQVLTRNASCRAALAGVQAWCAALGKNMPSNGTSAYCQARARLPLQCLRALFTAAGEWIGRRDRGHRTTAAGAAGQHASDFANYINQRTRESASVSIDCE